MLSLFVLGSYTLKLKNIILTTILAASSTLGLRADVNSDEASNAIISKYLAATTQSPSLRSPAMELEINASVPRLKEHGRLRALRKISKLGKITYRVLGFQGDNTIKKEVIGRYLQAEVQSQGDPKLTLTPDNYKFKLKGEQDLQGHQTYVFQISPRKKRVGLFKGEIWLDARSYLPVLEKGRLVKNPSIFFKKVDFERDFAIQDGMSVPAHMTSTIDTRLVGKVELDINYTVSSAGQDESDDSSETASLR